MTSEKPSRLKELDDGGWLIWCHLCGAKLSRRIYAESMDASRYWLEHEQSDMHAAAVQAWRHPTVSPEEKLLREIFGDPDEKKPQRQRRLDAARAAAQRHRPRLGGARRVDMRKVPPS